MLNGDSFSAFVNDRKGVGWSVRPSIRPYFSSLDRRIIILFKYHFKELTRDSISHSVGPLVGQSVRQSVTLFKFSQKN